MWEDLWHILYWILNILETYFHHPKNPLKDTGTLPWDDHMSQISNPVLGQTTLSLSPGSTRMAKGQATYIKIQGPIHATEDDPFLKLHQTISNNPHHLWEAPQLICKSHHSGLGCTFQPCLIPRDALMYENVMSILNTPKRIVSVCS